MKYTFHHFLILLFLYGCAPERLSDRAIAKGSILKLTNPTNKQRNELVKIDNSEFLEKTYSNLKKGIGLVGRQTVECLDLDKDGLVDKILVQANFKPKETISLDLLNDFEVTTSPKSKKTQAEVSFKQGGVWKGRKYEGGEFVNATNLRVPDQHTDHSYFIRYEGPGWENEKIGYRFYLDWRNAIDIFGKRVDTLVLQSVGQENFESYHELAPWGMDVLKAGKSLGIGSVGQYINGNVEHFQDTDSVFCAIESNNNLTSSIKTNYYGWKTSSDVCDLTSVLSIYSEDRAVKHELHFSKPIENFCTGIVKNNEAERMESLVGSNGWAYLATYGKQSLLGDNLGLAIIYNTKDVEYISDSAYDHLIVFKPSEENITYYLLGAWEQEKNSIANKEDFQDYLKVKLKQLNNPISVSFE